MHSPWRAPAPAPLSPHHCRGPRGPRQGSERLPLSGRSVLPPAMSSRCISRRCANGVRTSPPSHAIFCAGYAQPPEGLKWIPSPRRWPSLRRIHGPVTSANSKISSSVWWCSIGASYLWLPHEMPSAEKNALGRRGPPPGPSAPLSCITRQLPARAAGCPHWLVWHNLARPLDLLVLPSTAMMISLTKTINKTAVCLLANVGMKHALSMAVGVTCAEKGRPDRARHLRFPKSTCRLIAIPGSPTIFGL